MSQRWDTYSLADVAVIDPETITGPSDQLINYISLEDVSEGRILGTTRFHLSNAPSRARRRIRTGDALFGTVRPNLRSHAQYPGGLKNPVASTGFAVVRAKPERAIPGFLSQWLLSSEVSRQVDRLIAGSSYPAVSSADVRQFQISMPDVSEQQRIAKALEDVDRLIASIERMIAKKGSILQGMMQHLLTGRTRLPGFTEPWREAQLGDHVTYVKTVALSRAQLDSESPVRYLHYGDIHTRTNVVLDAAREPMPRASSALLRNAGRLRQGDLVFADASEDADGVGKSVEVISVPDAGIVPGLHTIAARFDKSVLTDGFKAYLQFIPSFRRALLRLAAGTKVLATTRSFISSITLSLPNIDEQRAIAAALDDGAMEMHQLQLRLAKMRDIKHGMMQELLTGRTRLSAEVAA